MVGDDRGRRRGCRCQLGRHEHGVAAAIVDDGSVGEETRAGGAAGDHGVAVVDRSGGDPGEDLVDLVELEGLQSDRQRPEQLSGRPVEGDRHLDLEGGRVEQPDVGAKTRPVRARLRELDQLALLTGGDRVGFRQHRHVLPVGAARRVVEGPARHHDGAAEDGDAKRRGTVEGEGLLEYVLQPQRPTGRHGRVDVGRAGVRLTAPQHLEANRRIAGARRLELDVAAPGRAFKAAGVGHDREVGGLRVDPGADRQSRHEGQRPNSPHCPCPPRESQCALTQRPAHPRWRHSG